MFKHLQIYTENVAIQVITRVFRIFVNNFKEMLIKKCISSKLYKTTMKSALSERKLHHRIYSRLAMPERPFFSFLEIEGF